jgi:hypothetical protein
MKRVSLSKSTKVTIDTGVYEMITKRIVAAIGTAGNNKLSLHSSKFFCHTFVILFPSSCNVRVLRRRHLGRSRKVSDAEAVNVEQRPGDCDLKQWLWVHSFGSK